MVSPNHCGFLTEASQALPLEKQVPLEGWNKHPHLLYIPLSMFLLVSKSHPGLTGSASIISIVPGHVFCSMGKIIGLSTLLSLTWTWVKGIQCGPMGKKKTLSQERWGLGANTLTTQAELWGRKQWNKTIHLGYRACGSLGLVRYEMQGSRGQIVPASASFPTSTAREFR